MKKITIATLFILLLPITIHAQKSEAKLIFKDGKVLQGLGTLTNAKTIRFRQTKKDKKQIYTFEEVDTLKVTYEYGTDIYVKMGIVDEIEPEILKILKVTDHIAFYHKKFFVGSGVNGRYVIQFYLRRKGEQRAVYFGSNSLITKNFKKVATTFFSDCEVVVQSIEDEKYNRQQLEEIIDLYEESCGQ